MTAEKITDIPTIWQAFDSPKMIAACGEFLHANLQACLQSAASLYRITGTFAGLPIVDGWMQVSKNHWQELWINAMAGEFVCSRDGQKMLAALAKLEGCNTIRATIKDPRTRRAAQRFGAKPCIGGKAEDVYYGL